MSSLTSPEVESKQGFKVPKMNGKGDSKTWITVKSLMRPAEIQAFDAKSKKTSKSVILVPTTIYNTESGMRKWVAEFRDSVPLGTKLVRDNDLDLVPIPVIKGG